MSHVSLLLCALLLSVCAAQLVLPIQRVPHTFEVDATVNRASSQPGVFRQGHSIVMHGGILTLGRYLADVELGTSNQTFSVIVDTGSSNFAVPAKGCVNCGDTSLYTPDGTDAQEVLLTDPACQICNTDVTSSTCLYGNPYAYPGSNGECGFGVAYGGGGSALAGVISIDRITLAPGVSVIGMFSQIQYQLAYTTAQGLNGVLGLAMVENSCNPTCVPTVIDLLYEQGVIGNNSFGICLSASNGGMLDLGEFRPERYVGALQWAISSTLTYYSVTVLDVQLGGNSLGLPAFVYGTSFQMAGSFVDCGTESINMAPAIYNVFTNLYQTKYGSLPGVSGASNLFNGHCFPGLNTAQYPAVTILIQGMDGTISLSVPASNYLLNASGQYCLGVVAEAGQGIVLGALVMQSYYVAHERSTHMLGFAPVAPNGGCVEQ